MNTFVKEFSNYNNGYLDDQINKFARKECVEIVQVSIAKLPNSLCALVVFRKGGESNA